MDSQSVRTGRLSSADWHRLTAAAGRLGEAPIFIDDSPGLTVLEARAKARRMKAEHGLDLVVIDYLQLMRGRAGAREPPAGDLGDLALAQGARQGAERAGGRALPALARGRGARAARLPAAALGPAGVGRPRAGRRRDPVPLPAVACTRKTCPRTRRTSPRSSSASSATAPSATVKVVFLPQYARFENTARIGDRQFEPVDQASSRAAVRPAPGIDGAARCACSRLKRSLSSGAPLPTAQARHERLREVDRRSPSSPPTPLVGRLCHGGDPLRARAGRARPRSAYALPIGIAIAIAHRHRHLARTGRRSRRTRRAAAPTSWPRTTSARWPGLTAGGRAPDRLHAHGGGQRLGRGGGPHLGRAGPVPVPGGLCVRGHRAHRASAICEASASRAGSSRSVVPLHRVPSRAHRSSGFVRYCRFPGEAPRSAPPAGASSAV